MLGHLLLERRAELELIIYFSPSIFILWVVMISSLIRLALVRLDDVGGGHLPRVRGNHPHFKESTVIPAKWLRSGEGRAAGMPSCMGSPSCPSRRRASGGQGAVAAHTRVASSRGGKSLGAPWGVVTPPAQEAGPWTQPPPAPSGLPPQVAPDTRGAVSGDECHARGEQTWPSSATSWEST